MITIIQTLEPDTSLKGFKNLSETIKIATGMLSQKYVPVLQRLTASYSTTTKAIKVGFADSSATLSKFVIKSWRVIQRGMNKDDENTLILLGNQLNTDFKNELAKFVDVSRSDLVEIYSQLLVETAGDKIEKLLKEKDILEKDLLRRSQELNTVTSEYSNVKAKVDSLKYEKQIYEMAIRDSAAAKLEVKQEIAKLIAQIPEYDSNKRTS